jgi:hypothetical protein
VCMYRAACDMTEVEITLSNVLIWTNGNTAESFPSDNANLNVVATLFSPTLSNGNPVKTTRNFSGSLASGAVNGVLAANAPASAWEYVEFSNGDKRWVKYTGSSTAAEWDTPLSSACTNVARIWSMSSRGEFQFDGASPGVLTGGVRSVIKSVMSGLNLKKDDPISVNCYVSKVGGGTFQLPANQPSNILDVLGNGLKECYVDSGSNYSSNRFGTAPFNATLTGGVNQFRPLALRGRNKTNTNYMEVVVIGDSIGSIQTSWVQKFLHKYKIPYINLCKAGEYSSSYLAQNTVRKQVYGGRVALVQMGANSYSLGQQQAMWAHLRASGFTKIIQVLVTPNTSVGSTGWVATDLSDQVANDNVRTVNAQIVALKGQPDGPDEVIDTTTPCIGADPDKWDYGLTGDGLHPNTTCIDTRILPYLDAQNYQALFLAAA